MTLNAENTSEDIRFDHEVDVRGLSCPLPILNTRKAVNALQPGEVLKITTSDHGAASDFPAFAHQMELDLLASRELDGIFHFFLRKP